MARPQARKGRLVDKARILNKKERISITLLWRFGSLPIRVVGTALTTHVFALAAGVPSSKAHDEAYKYEPGRRPRAQSTQSDEKKIGDSVEGVQPPLAIAAFISLV